MDGSDKLDIPATFLRGKGPVYPLNRNPGAPRDGLDPVENRKSLTLTGNRTVFSAARLYTE
jgi:hypothetical protein